jgi:two-component system, response regulator PdtaR
LPAFAKTRVLTVEDDPIVRADLRVILGEAGFDVCPDARDGIEAVELARTHRPDLILIDLNLPRLDGVEATRRILDERRLPIVALTGHGSGEFLERALEAGAVAHVLKPFHQAQLVGTITGALSSWVQDEQPAAATLADDDHYRQLVLVESMVSRNFSEREIVAALKGGYAPVIDLTALRQFGSRLLRLFLRRRVGD